VSDAWMPGVRYIRATADGGPLKGGAPRVVWGVLGANPRTGSARSAAQRLDKSGQASHLVWNPLHGEIVQLVPIVRAGCSLGAVADPGGLAGQPGWAPAAEINNEGRVCVQIRVVASALEPFTDGPLNRLAEIMAWLDSWGISRGWPAGRPAPFPQSHLTEPSRRLWARGGHFGESQVPSPAGAGPGAVDIERLTGWSAGRTGQAVPAELSPVPLTASRRPQPDDYDPAALDALLVGEVARTGPLTRVR
jgi:hypothetical protein